MKVLLFKHFSKPVVKDIDSSLESMQKIVGGMIQAVYPFEDPVAVVVNEEGKVNGLLPNRTLFDDNGKPYDIIYGDFFVCGLTTDDFGDIPEELIPKYEKAFGLPIIF